MKLHIEAPASAGTLFSIESALCGRRKPVDYRCIWWAHKPDKMELRAKRPFFATSLKKATCRTCLRLAKKLMRKR